MQERTEVIAEYARHKGDVGSPEVQIALLTNRIGHLTSHLQVHKHDNSLRRGLIKLVGRRRRLLRYLKREDEQKYQEISSKLNITVK